MLHHCHLNHGQIPLKFWLNIILFCNRYLNQCQNWYYCYWELPETLTLGHCGYIGCLLTKNIINKESIPRIDSYVIFKCRIIVQKKNSRVGIECAQICAPRPTLSGQRNFHDQPLKSYILFQPFFYPSPAPQFRAGDEHVPQYIHRARSYRVSPYVRTVGRQIEIILLCHVRDLSFSMKRYEVVQWQQQPFRDQCANIPSLSNHYTNKFAGSLIIY